MGLAAELLSGTTTSLRGAGRGPAPVSRHRQDIDGLRAVAVLSVVLYHGGLPWLSGGYVGVDVFFVISGFLITGLLLAEVQRTGTISLAGFYARRARRLLPLSTLVLASTAAATWFLLPPLVRPDVGEDVVAGAGFYANWHFALQSTDYMAADVDKSPLLHFWSLSVEEQYYVLWPLLILGCVRLAALLRRRRPVGAGPRSSALAADGARLPIAVALALLAAVSQGLSVTTSASAGSWAYFGLHTRAWELAAGAGLALAAPQAARLPVLARWGLGWSGLAAVLVCAVSFDGSTVFPGAAALVPVLATVALLAAGVAAEQPRRPMLVGSLLSTRPMTAIGRVSYGWYLWHWPVLILLRSRGPQSPWAIGLLTVGISLVLAAAGHRWVEQPVREARSLRVSVPRSLLLGGVMVGVSVLVGAALVAAPEPTSAALTQTPQQARELDERAQTQACNVSYDSDRVPEDCQFGDPAGTRVIALVGDSHAEHWMWAAEDWAKAHHVRLYVWTKSVCPLSGQAALLRNAPYDSCTRWRDKVMQRLLALPHLDAVVLGRSQETKAALQQSDRTKVALPEVPQAWASGLEPILRRLAPRTPAVVVLEDTPWPPADTLGCISSHLGDPSVCDFPRKAAVGRDGPLVEGERAVAARVHEPRLTFLDTTALICPDPTCHAVSEEGIIRYRDAHHLTVAFSRSLAEGFGAALERSLQGG